MHNNINLEIKRSKNKYFLYNFLYIYIIGILIIISLGFFIKNITNYNIYSLIYKINYNKIDIIDKKDITDLEKLTNICISTNCKYIMFNKDDGTVVNLQAIYNKESKDINTFKELKEINNFPSTYTINNTLTRDLYSVVNYNGKYTVLIDNGFIYTILNCIYHIVSIIIIGIYTFIYIIKNRFRYKDDLEEISKLKQTLEEITQKNVMSILNHELVLPLLECEKVLQEILEERFGCYVKVSPKHEIENACTLNNVCNFQCDQCEVVSGLTELSEFDKLLLNNIKTGLLDIGRIESVLNMFKKSKNIKSYNGTVTLKEIIMAAYENVSMVSISKLIIKIEHNDIFTTKSTGNTLNNTDLLNIFTNLFKNIKEANGNMIHVYTEYATDDKKYIYIYVKDNGTGIKDKNGRILSNKKLNTIFEFGKSSKNISKPRNMIEKIVNLILYKLLKVEPVNNDVGIGMYLNKKLLESVNGSISVVRTSVLGTVIKLKVPIKDTIKVRTYDDRKVNYKQSAKENIKIKNM